MSNQKPFDILIIGGGVAGCTAAYRLHQLGFRVGLLEQKVYPCDRLCGELLSPEAKHSFQTIGLLQKIESLQPAAIEGVLITTPSGAAYQGKIPGAAMGLSRYQLDWMLWRHCESAGVVAIQGLKAQRVEGEFEDGFTVTGVDKHQTSATFRSRFVIGAFGKRSNLDRTLGRKFRNRRRGFVAFKAHFEGLNLQKRVELHSFAGGYCGLCHIESGRINLCLIVKASVFRSAGANRERLFDRVLRANPFLSDRLDGMRRISPEFLSIAQIAFAPRSHWEDDVMMIGDAAELIAPLCGDGMAMAMRSAEICAPLVADYLHSRRAAPHLKAQYVNSWEREFRARLRWGGLLQFVLLHPPLASGAVRLLSRFPTMGQFLIEQTRDTKILRAHQNATGL